jgi:hypothetical protein
LNLLYKFPFCAGLPGHLASYHPKEHHSYRPNVTLVAVLVQLQTLEGHEGRCANVVPLRF